MEVASHGAQRVCAHTRGVRSAGLHHTVGTSGRASRRSLLTEQPARLVLGVCPGRSRSRQQAALVRRVFRSLFDGSARRARAALLRLKQQPYHAAHTRACSRECSRGRCGVRARCAGHSSARRRVCPRASALQGSYLVDPASSHMLVSKIKPCMSKYKLLYCETANGSLNQLWFI